MCVDVYTCVGVYTWDTQVPCCAHHPFVVAPFACAFKCLYKYIQIYTRYTYKYLNVC